MEAFLKDKIFAIGGAANCEPFSDVEMYDPDTGRWIPTCSMLRNVPFVIVGGRF